MLRTIDSPERRRTIRTYKDDYAGSESGSEMAVETTEEESDDEEDRLSIQTRLEQNKEYFDAQLSGDSDWNPQPMTTAEGDTITLIRYPTASHMRHRLLNPYIYRNIKQLGSLEALAALLETPSEWMQVYEQACQNSYLIDALTEFLNLPDNTPESYIHADFISLVTLIACLATKTRITCKSETKVMVGGILARYTYDLRSKTDPFFKTVDGSYLLATEIKTARTLAPDCMWYHDSRGVQVLTAMYAFNCPTFLLNQKQWKMFVENKERNAILTFPYGDMPNYTPHANSSLMYSIGVDLVKAIIICLMSKRHEKLISPNVSSSSSSVTATPEKRYSRAQVHNTVVKPARRSARLKEKHTTVKSPSFISGYVDGHPVYSPIRIVPESVVSAIEVRIANDI